MKTHDRLQECPLRDIEPMGWLRQYLETQRDGLTGHLEEAGAPFGRVHWANAKRKTVEYEAADTEEWWPYEQTGYWIDGMTKCGYLLRDNALIAKALLQLEAVLDNPDSDGYLGPAFIKQPVHVNR